MPDYGTLRVIWWILLGVLLTGYAVTDGFDLGAATLLPFIAKGDSEKRVVINALGPVWESNQVWLVLGAGAIFAAWPPVYAVAFSGLYFAMFIVLLAFIMRPVGFKFRSKIEDSRWRLMWDSAIFLSGVIPAILFGVAMGNILMGLPFHFDLNLQSYYTGSFFALLNPFALICGLISLAMFLMHGGLYLGIKTTDQLRVRSIRVARYAGFALIALSLLAAIWLMLDLHGFSLIRAVQPDGPSNPLYKKVATHLGAWGWNFRMWPILTLIPLLAFLGVVGAIVFANRGEGRCAFLFSGLGIAGIFSTVGAGMFPFILPSSTNPAQSLLVWDASSSQLTLFIMLVAALIFMPIILIYITWMYRVMRGKITPRDIQENEQTLY